MNAIIVIGLMLAISSVCGWGNLPENPEEYKAWEMESLETIEAQKNVPPSEAIPKLGRWTLKFSEGMNREQNDRPVFHAAQSALLAIPGHAKYYQDQIEETRELVKQHAKLPQEDQFRLQREGKWKGLGDYYEVSRNALNVLGLLPSPETVAVLGHFIEDPQGRDYRDILGNLVKGSDDLAPESPICAKAFFAFDKLGIAHPPAKVNYPRLGEIDFDLDRVDKWKDWWGEVKAGKRTYRFIGSDIEYGPDGPATKEQLEKIARDRKRAEEQRKGGSGSSSVAGQVSSQTPLVASVLAGITVLASLIWYFRRAAKRGAEKVKSAE